jgi:hypothetical protein
MDLKLTERLFENLDEKEKEDNLAAACFKVVDNHTFEKKFSKDEKSDLKDQYTDLNMQIEEIEEELSEVSKGYKDQVKALKKLTKDLRIQIKTGTIPAKERVFMFLNEESMTMSIYDRNGVRVSIRPLTPDERQREIPLYPKTGTDY